MDHILQAIVIGVVQGLTEFLPISSSAHLIVVPRILGWDDPLLNSAAFDVMLHMGTLVALLVYFWRDLVRLVAAGIRSIAERRIGDDPDRRLAWLLLVSAIPGAILGAVGESFFDTFFRERLFLVAVLALIGAAILWLAERQGSRRRELGDLRIGDAAIVGAAQALALFPGISRSGITISAGLFVGLTRDAAARFSFLMGTPIIAGAGIWKLRTLLGPSDVPVELVPLLAGMAAAALAGLLAISVLLAFVRTRGYSVFVIYRLLFAAVIVVFVLAR
jgi:undecaprenyl-diphosphatase